LGTPCIDQNICWHLNDSGLTKICALLQCCLGLWAVSFFHCHCEHIR
jgi:hypothetical protein